VVQEVTIVIVPLDVKADLEPVPQAIYLWMVDVEISTTEHVLAPLMAVSDDSTKKIYGYQS
jgi:hypothetical protein